MTHRVQAESISAPMYEVRRASAADGGTSLSTTLALISLPKGSEWVSLTPRNFSTAVVVKIAINPWLAVLKTTDNFALEANLESLSEELQDADATDVDLNSFGGSDNYLYVGAPIPFRGAQVDVSDVNGTTNALTVEYHSGNGTWVDISATDGTSSVGASLAQDGNVTWTVPANWVRTGLPAIISGAFNGNSESRQNWYWTRWSWDNAHDSDTSIDQLRALNRSTNYLELASGQAYEQKIFVKGGLATIEALTDAGTANLIVNVATPWGDQFA